MPRAFLTPIPSLGSGSRIGPAILISSRNGISSQGRIYNYENARGQGQSYIRFLSGLFGPPRTPYANGKYGASPQLNLSQFQPAPVLIESGSRPRPGGSLGALAGSTRDSGRALQ